jgi:hypothetical protein
MTIKCKDCLFFHADSGGGAINRNDVGQCRRNVPEMVPTGFGKWAVVRNSDWCGNFRPRVKPAE